MRRPGGFVGILALALTLGACSGDLPSVTPRCDDRGAITLMAQAVPEADSVVCFDEVPFAFEATTFDVESGSVDLALSHEVVGNDAVTFHLARECVVPGTRQTVPRPDEGRKESVEVTKVGGIVGTWVEAVGEACLVVRFDLDNRDGQRAFEDVADRWRFIPSGALRS